MKIIRYITFVLVLPLAAFADKIADYPNVTQPASNQLFLVTSANAATNNNVSFGQLTNSLRNAAGLTNLNVAKITDAGTAAYSNSASFASAQQGTILTNNGTFDVTWAGNLTVDSSHNLNVTTFNVTTGNFGSLVLTNVDGSFWTNLNASELRSGTVPSARLTGDSVTNGVIKTDSAAPDHQAFIGIPDNTVRAEIDNSTAPGFIFTGGDVRVVGGGFIGTGGNITAMNATQLTSGTVPYGRLTGDLGLISTNNAANLTNLVFDLVTNTWAINTDFPLGNTNVFLTSGAATGGITGLANKSTSTARYGELTIIATGNVVFTNPVSMHASDFLSSRTITNGNTCEIAIKLIPGQCTNLSIAQFK